MASMNVIGWTFNVLAVMLNGLALLHFTGQINLAANLIPAVLVFDMIALPIVSWGAYRLGEMAEVEYVKEHMQRAADQQPPKQQEGAETKVRDKLD